MASPPAFTGILSYSRLTNHPYFSEVQNNQLVLTAIRFRLAVNLAPAV